MENCWFADWFNTKYYHILYKNRDDNEAQAFMDCLMLKLNLQKNAKLLDVACGKGRHSKYLSSKGYNVTGIDLSSESIGLAAAFETENLMFFEHDMRLPFRINYFDASFNLFTSLGYFENDSDNYKAITSISKSLKNNGILVIDFFNSNYITNNLVAHFSTVIENVKFNITKKISNGFIIKDIEVIDNENTYQYQEKVQLITLQNFENYFNNAGLKIVWTAGNYALDKFDINESARLIVCAQKFVVV